VLDVGVAIAPPLIRAVKEEAEGELVLIDAPPGTSCPVIAAVRETDYVVLVTEPTPFGLNDLRLAVDVVRELGIPFGAVVNRAQEGDDLVRPYLDEENIALLAEIPHDRRIAEVYATGKPVVEALPEYEKLFTSLLHRIREEA